jgi:hypothetical protein
MLFVSISAAAPALAVDAGRDAATPGPHIDGLRSGDSPACMRCHWMETLAYRDPDTREIVNLSVDRDAYRHSVHAGLACRDCHARGYQAYPHRTGTADEALTCVGCHAEHQNDPERTPPDLTHFDVEYRQSAHARLAKDAFGCLSCHDPHRFRPVANDAPVAEVIAANNVLCLDCHTELDTPAPKGHTWLPRPREHWSAVRCIDCHTPVGGRDLYAPSHLLLGADDSNQNCVECHSQRGELLAQLYTHRAAQEREQKGFLAHAIYNDAYIVGMSRSPRIDRLGLAVLGLMLLGIAAHGYGRHLAHKRRRESQ